MSPPLTRAAMDGVVCYKPGCTCTSADGLFLTPACHPAKPVRVLYRDGTLTISCAACDLPVTEIAVAP